MGNRLDAQRVLEMQPQNAEARRRLELIGSVARDHDRYLSEAYRG